jgi:tight adherence protein B
MSVLVALAVGVLIFAASLMVMTAYRRLLVRRRMQTYAPAATRRTVRTQIDRGTIMSGLERQLERVGVHRHVVGMIDRAGIDLSAGALVLLDVAVALVGFAFMATRTGVGKAILVGILAGAVPWVFLTVKGARRSRAFEGQLPEVLDTLSASLRAGHGFDAALQTVANDLAEPAAREFRRVLAEVHLGRSLEQSLADLGDRIRSKDLKFVLDAITIQRQVGGSLAELFELVAETVRSREQFRRKVRALTGMVRMSANVLTVMPFLAAVLLTLLNRSYMQPLWTTNAGHLMVAIALVMMTFGTITLRRIGTVKG